MVCGHGARGVPRVLVGVDLHVHRETLDALLRAEVRAEALYGDVDLGAIYTQSMFVGEVSLKRHESQY